MKICLNIYLFFYFLSFSITSFSQKRIIENSSIGFSYGKYFSAASPYSINYKISLGNSVKLKLEYENLNYSEILFDANIDKYISGLQFNVSNLFLRSNNSDKFKVFLGLGVSYSNYKIYLNYLNQNYSFNNILFQPELIFSYKLSHRFELAINNYYVQFVNEINEKNKVQLFYSGININIFLSKNNMESRYCMYNKERKELNKNIANVLDSINNDISNCKDSVETYFNLYKHQESINSLKNVLKYNNNMFSKKTKSYKQAFVKINNLDSNVSKLKNVLNNHFGTQNPYDSTKYYIQIGALDNEHQQYYFIEKYHIVNDIVLKNDVGNMFKYLIGPYDNYKKASEHQQAITNNGCSDCFIVAYLNERQIALDYSFKQKIKPNKNNNKNVGIVFKIQIAANVKPDMEYYFAQKCNITQKIDVIKEGTLYKYLLGKFKTYKEVNDAITKIKSESSCKDIFIVAFKNSEKIDVKDAIKLIETEQD